jgi:hypothetical protein
LGPSLRARSPDTPCTMQSAVARSKREWMAPPPARECLGYGRPPRSRDDFDVERALQEARFYTPEDTIIIRNIGTMGVRPTQIMMNHTAPGEIWWDG